MIPRSQTSLTIKMNLYCRFFKVGTVVNSLPLLVEVVVDPPVGDGHHDDEDPQQHHAHHELVHHPHGHRGRLQVTETEVENST